MIFTVCSSPGTGILRIIEDQQAEITVRRLGWVARLSHRSNNQTSWYRNLNSASSASLCLLATAGVCVCVRSSLTPFPAEQHKECTENNQLFKDWIRNILTLELPLESLKISHFTTGTAKQNSIQVMEKKIICEIQHISILISLMVIALITLLVPHQSPL